MNFPGEFYYSNNYIDCISFTPQKSYYRILNLSFWTQCYFHWMAYSTSGHIFQCLYIHVSVKIMCISVSCQRFLDFIANDRLCVSPKNFQFVRFLASWLSKPFFSLVDILFCFTILKFNFILRYIHNYTSARRLKIECDSMYIEKWISLFW